MKTIWYAYSTNEVYTLTLLIYTHTNKLLQVNYYYLTRKIIKYTLFININIYENKQVNVFNINYIFIYKLSVTLSSCYIRITCWVTQ